MKFTIKKVLFLIMIMSVSILFTGCSKQQSKPVKVMNQSNQANNNLVSSVAPSQSNGNTLPQSNIQNNFTVTLDGVELTEDATNFSFKISNKTNVAVTLYFDNGAKLVQGTKQYESVKDTFSSSEFMPNVEAEGILIFPPLENKDTIMLYLASAPYSSSLPNAKWGKMQFEVDLSGDGIIDRVAEEERGQQAMEAKVDYTTGWRPYFVSIDDLNSDGKNDMVVANEGPDTISVFINNGDGTFVDKVDYVTGPQPHSISIGDLNGDGKNDMVVTNDGSFSYSVWGISVLLNNGDGTFATKVDYIIGDKSQSVFIDDLNNDEKNDLVVVKEGSYKAISVLLNNGDGTFTTQIDYITDSKPYFISISDLNGDGKNDMAMASAASIVVSVFLNNGDGTFTTKADNHNGLAAPRPVSMSNSMGDLNGDGKNDVAAIHGSGFSTFLNNGDGTFTTKVKSIGVLNAHPHSVSMGDLNSDGKNDIAVANEGSDTISVFINNGDGTFTTQIDYSTGSDPYSVVVSDLNGDGKNDMAVANHGSATVSVFINNGKW